MEALNQWFNAFIDISHVVVIRLSELPYPFVVASLALGVTLFFLTRQVLCRFRGRPAPGWQGYPRAVAVTLALGMVTQISQRLDLILSESRELQYFARLAAVKSSSLMPAVRGSDDLQLIDRWEMERGLAELFPEFDSEVVRLGQGIEFASVRSSGPHPIACYVTMIDLAEPCIEIEITEEFGDKSLTSNFAVDHDCVVAINGEAGMTPARAAPLGRWTGNWVVDGRPVLLEDSSSRPFISFDRDNHATYSPAKVVDVELTENKYNVIWGRKDLLRGGEYTPDRGPRWNRASPRTLMGLDATGTRLILVVVDGRQQGYSVGMDLETSAKLLQVFGAHDAMWCDQGGSSTMYLDCISEIVNRPSDGHERPTYSHFGIALKR